MKWVFLGSRHLPAVAHRFYFTESLFPLPTCRRVDRVYLAFSQHWKLLINAENMKGLKVHGSSQLLPSLSELGGWMGLTAPAGLTYWLSPRVIHGAEPNSSSWEGGELP